MGFRIDKDLEAKLLSMPGVTVNGQPVAPPEPPPIPGLTEEQFMASIIALAKRNGWRHYHPRDSRKSVSGWPDLVMVRGERILYVECKTDSGRTTADQEDWIELLRGAGQTVYVWRPADWKVIEGILA